MSMNPVVLHGYWRSSASYRVRIALCLKGVPFEQVTHDLKAGAQRAASYRGIAPHGLVPALEIAGSVILESPAILEWIEAEWPSPHLLPEDPLDAATVRSICALIACDIHPLNNLRVLNELRREFSATDEQITTWIGRWITTGFEAVETLIAQHGATYAFGDSITLADCSLVPQVYNARRFEVDLSPFPRLQAVADAAGQIPAFLAAHPDSQPDAGP